MERKGNASDQKQKQMLKIVRRKFRRIKDIRQESKKNPSCPEIPDRTQY